MSLQKQFKVMKENWLLILILVVFVIILQAIFYSGSFGVLNFNSGDTYGDGISKTSGNLGIYNSGVAPEFQDRILTYSAYLSLEVGGGVFEEKSLILKDFVKNSKGLIISESVSDGDYGKNAYYSVRIPLENYDSFISNVESLGKVKNLNKNSDDITEGYYSLENELKAENARLQRFQNLYDSTTNINDKISLTDKIFDLERRVSYLEDSLKNTNERIEYVTVQVNIYEKQLISGNTKLIDFTRLAEGLVKSINSIFLLIVYLIPYLVLIFLLWLLIKNLRKK